MEEPGATGEEETPSLPARGKPRATRQWVISRPLAEEEPGATRQRANPGPSGKEEPGATGKGKTLSQLAEGKPRATRQKESSEPPRRRENLSRLALGETPGHVAKRKL